MKKIITSLLLTIILILAGCGTVTQSQQPTITPASTSASSEFTEPPIDRTWISPGKVNIANFYPGGQAEYYISIHNGNSKDSSFKVTYRIPGRIREPYLSPPEAAKDWVIIANQTPIIEPYTTKDILITLYMPDDAVAPDQWEFWVSVIDEGQKGLLQTELCSRWLIDMR